MVPRQRLIVAVIGAVFALSVGAAPLNSEFVMPHDNQAVA